MVIKIIDIHCHLTFEQYDTDRDQVIAAVKQDLNAVITSGVDPEDAKKTLELAELHEDFIFVSLGLHPIHVAGKTD
ncbi:MAG: TatD family hydrolase, partial [Methanococcoides sp.]|nr:TatD family hydrolase [Methanococcoides sp.]